MTPAQVRSRVRRIAATVPQPKEGVKLLLETLKDTSGSDCIAATYFWVYGAYLPIEKVMDSYRRHLMEAGWKEVYIDKTQIAPQAYERRIGVFSNRAHTLFVDRVDSIEWVVIRTGSYQQEYFLKEQAQRFEALFIMSVTVSSCSN